MNEIPVYTFKNTNYYLNKIQKSKVEYTKLQSPKYVSEHN